MNKDEVTIIQLKLYETFMALPFEYRTKLVEKFVELKDNIYELYDKEELNKNS